MSEMTDVGYVPHKSETLWMRYQVYLSCADDGTGHDITNGKPLLSFWEWINNTGEK